MDLIYTTTTARIWGTTNAWSAAQTEGPDQPNCECTIKLEIQGTDRNGYILVMSPSGFFTADYWYPTKQDALDDAFEIFSAARNAWSDVRPTGSESRGEES